MPLAWSFWSIQTMNILRRNIDFVHSTGRRSVTGHYFSALDAATDTPSWYGLHPYAWYTAVSRDVGGFFTTRRGVYATRPAPLELSNDGQSVA